MIAKMDTHQEKMGALMGGNLQEPKACQEATAACQEKLEARVESVQEEMEAEIKPDLSEMNSTV
jgi:hypothetical protein